MAERERIDALPLVSLVTLNYNQAAVTCALLASTRRLTYPRFEVIVVDNGSPEDPMALIEQGRYPHVRVVKTGMNLGFAGGNNVGLQHAQGDYVLFLNNDTEVTPNLIEQLLQPFADDPTVGVVCPKIWFYSHPGMIQYAGYGSLNPYTGQVRPIGTHEADQGQYDESGVTNFAHGAAMLVSRRAIEQAGPMPELYFLYYEELDWSRRIQQAGYRIYYQATALIYHKESISVGRRNPLKVYYHTRNRLLFMRRNVGGWPLLVFFLHFTCLAFPKAVALYTLKGQWAFLGAFLKGVGWNLTRSVARPGVVSPPKHTVSTRTPVTFTYH